MAKDLGAGKISLVSSTCSLCLKLFYIAFVCEKEKFLSDRVVCRLSNPSKIRVFFFFFFSSGKGHILISYKENPLSVCCLVITTVWKLIMFLTSKFPGESKDKDKQGNRQTETR